MSKVESSDPNSVTQLLRGANGQAVDLFQVKNYAGTELFGIDKDGNVSMAAGNAVMPPSFTVFKSGSTYYAKNGTTGALDESGSDAATVIQAALDALTAGRAHKEAVALKGAISLADYITVPSYTQLQIIGKLTQTAEAAPLILSENHDIEIVGGIIDVGQLAQGIYGIDGCYDVVIRGVKVLNAADAQQGIYLRGYNLSVLNCHVDTAGAGILIGCDDDEAVFTPKNNKIIGNYVTNTSDDCIALDNCIESIVAHNICDKNNAGNVDGACGIKLFGRCKHVGVVENILYNLNCGGGNYNHGIGDDINSLNELMSYILIAGNIIYTVAGAGLNIGGTADYHPTKIGIFENTIYDTNKGEFAWGGDIRLYYSDEVHIAHNYLAGTIYRLGDTNTKIEHNRGYITEVYGSATILSGQTSVTVTHGLSATPTRVLLTGTTSDTSALYADNIGATTFNINAPSTVGANRTVYYHAVVES